MKKRIFMLLLGVVLLLSFSTSVMAAQYSLDGVTAEYKTVYKVNERKGKAFTIRVRAVVFENQSEVPYPSATTMHWSVSQDANAIENLILSSDTSPSDNIDTLGNGTLSATLKGTIVGAGEVRVTGTLYDGGDPSKEADNGHVVQYATIKFSTDNKDDEKSKDSGNLFADNDTPDLIDHVDPAADPTSSKWDGIDPNKDPYYYTRQGGEGPATKKGGKPSLKTSKLAFEAGKPKSEKIVIKGASPSQVGIYIAVKDAIKLGWLEKDATAPIPLNRTNIASHNIPFRITSFDIISKDDKNAESSFTLSFSGAMVAYKAFPLTFELHNTNTGSKPVTKAVKIDVTPNTNVPVWYYDGYEDKTLSFDLEDEFESGDTIGKISGTVVIATDIEEVVEEAERRLGSYDITSIILEKGNYFKSGDEAIASGDTTYVRVVYKVAYKSPARLPVPKKGIEVVAKVGGDNDGKLEDTKFYVSGDKIGPYTIPEPKAPKDEGITIHVDDPEYNNFGEVAKQGYVTIGGNVSNTEKETKNSITLTATNPSTGKKGTAKITVIGKTAPEFDTKKWEDGKMPTKYVEGGKVPSVKFKAKGSKTITYSVDAATEAALNAVGLTFDGKKGAVAAKTDKKSILPTLNDKEEFEPITITVTAENEAGTAQAVADVGVTGAKVKFNKETPTFTVGDAAGKTGTPVTLKNVKYDTKGYKVKFTENEDKNKVTLNDLGLKIVDTWTADRVSTDAVVSEDINALDSADKTVIAAKGKFIRYIVLEGNAAVDGNGNLIVSGDKGAKVQIAESIKSGDKANTQRNTLIFELNEPSKLEGNLKKGNKENKIKVNILATNYGAEVNSSVTIVIKPASASSQNKNKSTANNSTVEEVAVRTKTNKGGGTAYEFYYDGETQPETKTETENEEAVVLGAPRTVAQLTAGQTAFLAEKGYKVVAVLPEVTAKVDGQQEFEVELDEDAPEGAKLIWLPFPKNAEETDDDTIADFYDAEGSDIEEVPAGKVIVVAPWLRAGVTYQPVIAVEE